jgi:hypothetical protein
MRMVRSFFLLSGCVVLAACSTIPNEAYFNRGTPESLLDRSSEVVSLPVKTSLQVNELSSWVNRDQPTRAELYCNASNPQCQDAKETLSLFGVPTTTVPSVQSTVTLVYERTLARDCEQRYIDNRINPYNLNHPTFGCATAANMVQQISDKQQILNPHMMDNHDASKAVQSYRKYLRQSPRSTTNSVSNSLTGSISTR